MVCLSNKKIKYWTIGQIDATGVRGPHEKELEDISRNKCAIFKDISMDKLAKIVEENLGGKIENIGFNEDWTISIEMFPEVNIHMSYSFFGDEFGDGIESEFKFYFSGERALWVPGEDSATYIDIVMNMLERIFKEEAPFEKKFEDKTELMDKVLIQRKEAFKFLGEQDKHPLSEFMGSEIWKTTEGWRLKKESFPNIFTEIVWDKAGDLDIKFTGDNLERNIDSYHMEFIGIFTINHILRYITISNIDMDLPSICYIMFSRLFTKEKNWDHRLN